MYTPERHFPGVRVNPSTAENPTSHVGSQISELP